MQKLQTVNADTLLYERFSKYFISLFFNHPFIKGFRNPQRTSVKGFIPHLVKLPVPLVPLLVSGTSYGGQAYPAHSPAENAGVFHKGDCGDGRAYRKGGLQTP